MKRDIEKLSTGHFDMVIVGAGIHGVILAYEASKAGYSVAIVDKGDFGSSTSANSLKIIHGGIRYLQHGDFKRMRESICSRRAMMQFAPHLVRPLACMMPTYGHGVKGRETMRTAFGLYDLIAWDRNRGLAEVNHLPNSATITAEEVRWVVPGVSDEGLSGGAVWYDAISDSTERLVMEYVHAAVRYGAVAANYVKVCDYKAVRSRVVSVIAEDLPTGERLEISAKTVINAGGPWVGELGEDLAGLQEQLWSVAVNIVVKKRLFKKFAVGLEGRSEYRDKDAIVQRGKRLFFFVPWQDEYTMIGTTYYPYQGSPDNFSLGRDDLLEIISQINMVCSPLELSLEDVSFFHGGLLPMKESDQNQTDSVQLEKSTQIIDHGRLGGTVGLFSIKGVKYTTAPDIALKTLKRLEKGRHLPPGCRAGYRLQPRRPRNFDSLIKRLGADFGPLLELLRRRYGSGWREVLDFFADEKSQTPQLLSDKPLLYKAELDYFIQMEQARTLGDVVFRRSGLCTSEYPGDAVISEVARSMGVSLGWDEEVVQAEIESVKRIFAIIEPR